MGYMCRSHIQVLCVIDVTNSLIQIIYKITSYEKPNKNIIRF